MKKSIDNQSRGLSEEHGVSNTDHADLTFYERLCKSARTPSAEKMTHENIKPFFSDDSLSDKEVVTNLINHYKSESSSSSPFSWLKVMGQQYFFGENAPSTIPPSFRFDLAVVLSLHISGEIDLLKEFPQKSFACMEGLAGKMGEAISSHYGTPEGKLLNAYLSEVSRDLVEKGHVLKGNEIHALTGLKYIFGLVSENEAKQMDPSYRFIFSLSPNSVLPLMERFYNKVLPQMVSETEKVIRDELALFNGAIIDTEKNEILLSVVATHPWLRKNISEIIDIDMDDSGKGVFIEDELAACIPYYPPVKLPQYDAFIRSEENIDELSSFERRTMLHVLRTLGESATGTAPMLQNVLLGSLSEESKAPHYLPTMRMDIGKVPDQHASSLDKIMAGASIGALEEEMEISSIDNVLIRLLSTTLAERNDGVDIYDQLTWSDNVDIEARNIFFTQLLTDAITYDNMPLMESIVEDAPAICIDTIVAGNFWQSPLHLACQLNHVQALDLLSEKEGVILDNVNEKDFTPLLMACYYGHVEIVKTLLKQGAEIEKADEKGFTPLLTACSKGHGEVVRALLEKEAEIDKANLNGFTPLLKACSKGHGDVVRALLEKEAEIDKAHSNGFTPLIVACQNGHVKVLKMLLEKGAAVDKAHSNGTTPLLMACKKGHVKVVEMLLEQGAKIEEEHQDGATPLMIACQNGHVKIVKTLLEQGAEINKADSKGFTPLLMACEYGDVDIVEALLEQGAEIDKADSTSFTPLLMACEDGAVAIVDMLLEKGAKIDKAHSNGATSLLLACQKGHGIVVEMLLEKGADINQGLYGGAFTPLMVAALVGKEQVVDILLKSPHANLEYLRRPCNTEVAKEFCQERNLDIPDMHQELFEKTAADMGNNNTIKNKIAAKIEKLEEEEIKTNTSGKRKAEGPPHGGPPQKRITQRSWQDRVNNEESGPRR